MQRKQIKVGTAYAVVTRRPSRGRYATADKAVKGTVVGVELEYEKQDRYSYRPIKKSDGILVRFDKPMVETYVGFRPKRKDDVSAVTEFVLTSAQCVVSTWAEYQEEERAGREQEGRWARDAEAASAAFEPRLKAIIKKLKEAGFKDFHVHGDKSGLSFDGGSIGFSTSTDSKGNRVATGIGYNDVRLQREAFVKLLGLDFSVDEDDEVAE